MAASLFKANDSGFSIRVGSFIILAKVSAARATVPGLSNCQATKAIAVQAGRGSGHFHDWKEMRLVTNNSDPRSHRPSLLNQWPSISFELDLATSASMTAR
ncbi:unnamed protein product [Victoria cruziana]